MKNIKKMMNEMADEGFKTQITVENEAGCFRARLIDPSVKKGVKTYLDREGEMFLRSKLCLTIDEAMVELDKLCEV